MVDITSVETVAPDGAQMRPETSRAGMDYTPPVRTGAFRAAGRHTSRVRFLRRAMIVGSVLMVSIIAVVAIFDPFRHLPGSISIGGVGVKGSKITMDTPKIAGVQQNGGRYDVAADTGIQDITTPGEIELLGVNAHIGMADGTGTHVLSKHGLYNSERDTMALDGDVKIANTSGYTFGLQTATVDFKRGLLSSQQRMRVDLKGGFINADGVTIGDNGHKVTFRGNVSSTFDSADDSDASGPSPEIKAVTPLETKP